MAKLIEKGYELTVLLLLSEEAIASLVARVECDEQERIETEQV